MASLPPVTLTANKWINLYTAASITVGKKIKIQNLHNQQIFFTESLTEPSSNLDSIGRNVLERSEYLTSSDTPVGAWVMAISDTALQIEVVAEASSSIALVLGTTFFDFVSTGTVGNTTMAVATVPDAIYEIMMKIQRTGSGVGNIRIQNLGVYQSGFIYEDPPASWHVYTFVFKARLSGDVTLVSNMNDDAWRYPKVSLTKIGESA